MPRFYLFFLSETFKQLLNKLIHILNYQNIFHEWQNNSITHKCSLNMNDLKQCSLSMNDLKQCSLNMNDLKQCSLSMNDLKQCSLSMNDLKQCSLSMSMSMSNLKQCFWSQVALDYSVHHCRINVLTMFGLSILWDYCKTDMITNTVSYLHIDNSWKSNTYQYSFYVLPSCDNSMT